MSEELNWSNALTVLGACPDAVAWAKTQPSLAVAWQRCERGDWMIWLLGRLDTSAPWSEARKPLVRAAVACARLALPYTQDVRIAACLNTVDGWLEGKATVDAVRQARSTADTVYAISPAAADAAYAVAAAYAAAAVAAAVVDAVSAVSAVYAVAAAYAVADAASAVAHAAYAAAYAAADSASAVVDAANASYVVVKKDTLKTCADIVRQHFPPPRLEA